MYLESLYFLILIYQELNSQTIYFLLKFEMSRVVSKRWRPIIAQFLQDQHYTNCKYLQKHKVCGEQGSKLAIESPVGQWLEHTTKSRRVLGSDPIWVSDFSKFVSLCITFLFTPQIT